MIIILTGMFFAVCGFAVRFRHLEPPVSAKDSSAQAHPFSIDDGPYLKDVAFLVESVSNLKHRM